MDFRSLPPAPDHPRYLKRLKEIDSLLRSRKDRLVEEGMCMDAATAEDDFWWFCLRCTPYSSYKITERGHDMRGQLWIHHPFQFWLCRLLQQLTVEPPEGWVWLKAHRDSHKTTTVLDWELWLLARDETETIGMWTHKAAEIGDGMGRGLLSQVQTDELRDYWPQFRNLKQGTKQGFTVDRQPGPREQSVTIASILSSMTSIHPRTYVLDDVVTEQLRDNPEQIAKVAKNISALAALLRPDSPVICLNTPWDEADPLVQREKDGLFAAVYEQPCYGQGRKRSYVINEPRVGEKRVECHDTPIDSNGAGGANLHTERHFASRRTEINDDSIYFPQFELKFHKAAHVLFDWNDIQLYDDSPENLARRFPYINIVIDGAGGKAGSDFTYIRVATWVAHDQWANLDCIRERVGWSKAAQILLGRDRTDESTAWIDSLYTKKKMGVVEYWMQFDPNLIIWFDEHANQGWMENFKEAVRIRRVTFNGKTPTLKAVPEIHHGKKVGSQRAAPTKLWLIQKLDAPYSQKKVWYPRAGFRHGSYNGLAGEDKRDTMTQFQQDEFDRMKLGKLPPFDDGLDTEKVLGMQQAQQLMRRPKEGDGGLAAGVRRLPMATIDNPFGIPGGGIIPNMPTGRTWVSM